MSYLIEPFARNQQRYREHSAHIRMKHKDECQEHTSEEKDKTSPIGTKHRKDIQEAQEVGLKKDHNREQEEKESGLTHERADTTVCAPKQQQATNPQRPQRRNPRTPDDYPNGRQTTLNLKKRKQRNKNQKAIRPKPEKETIKTREQRLGWDGPGVFWLEGVLRCLKEGVSRGPWGAGSEC
ncbi:hypothetical protein BDN71DRAFT_1501864 [Pleurotus eryngii]|uniref:Uncharacterized protein n=1 Tax=Pleurotus eryngii TaxID=5323 RepID=A0A9P6A9F0_PLEER|nr:hypothetical protein BDN71DRAFT_1501864 [Pleurotus eryngii]